MTKKQNKASSPNLAMRFSNEDKQRLRELSSLMMRSQTDTVRVLVRERLASYSLAEKPKKTAKGSRT